MAIVENQTNRVVAHRFNIPDSDVLFSDDEYFLARSVTLDLGARAVGAEIFRRKIINLT